MNDAKNRVIHFMLVLLLAMAVYTLTGCGKKSLDIPLKTDYADAAKYGNLGFDMPADVFLKTFAQGDIVTVTVNGLEPLEVPICVSYDDVSPGELLIRAVPGKPYVVFAANYGQTGVLTGLMQPTPEGSGSKYEYTDEASSAVMHVELKEAGGYKERLVLSSLERPVSMDGYTEITEAQFANYREICMGGIGSGILYRSSSPIDPAIGRNICADSLMAADGVRTVVNLADHQSEAEEFEGYAGSYYAQQDVIFLALPVALNTEVFRSGLAEGLRYMISHEGPYLVHCSEGKDRAGFVSAMLELLMGASMEEVQADYLKTYENYFTGVTGAEDQLTDSCVDTIRGMILHNLKFAFGIEDTAETDMNAAAEEYLREIGLSDAEIGMLRDRLSGRQ